MMKKRIKQGGALILTAVLALSVFVLPKAYAADGVDVDQECTLTVDVANENLSELVSGTVTVNLYKVADIKVTGEYNSLVEGVDFSDISSETTAEDWEKKAAAVVKVVDKGEVKEEATGETTDGKVEFAGLSTGMYLVYAEQMLSDYNQYDFTPYLISLPDNRYYSTGNDTWLYDITVSLKPEKTDRYGDLVINKTLDLYNATNGGATFVFQIEASKTDVDTKETKVVYSDVVSMTFNGAGTDSIRIEDIPAGAEVTVTEVYSGANYELTSDATQTATVVVNDEAPAQVSFSNTHDNRTNGGNGLVNTFTYDDGEWTNSATEDSTP